ncbi:hypothetical protein [Cohnella rhizosphaerae]|uniref:hypothetical protein n=1 Tax=Cohnella rhizosphaerae TaxID=1457232 RepID=UPI0030B87939
MLGAEPPSVEADLSLPPAAAAPSSLSPPGAVDGSDLDAVVRRLAGHAGRVRADLLLLRRAVGLRDVFREQIIGG